MRMCISIFAPVTRHQASRENPFPSAGRSGALF